MFIPFGFEYAYQRTAWVTWGLVVAMVVCFFAVDLVVLEHRSGPAESVEEELEHPGKVETITPLALNPKAFRLHQLVTSSFAHDGIFHLVGNLIFLIVFGRYVEDRLGPLRFAAFWLASDVSANLVQLAFGGPNPSVGASGAVSALMGYVLVAAPWLEMRFAFLIGTFARGGMELAAGWLLVPWVLLQLVEASLGSMSSIAVAAHLGGFAFGAGAAALMRSRFGKDTAWYIDPRPPQGGRAAVERLARARGRA